MSAPVGFKRTAAPVLFAVAAILTGAATAQNAADDAHYRACMTRVGSDPQGAFDMALAWTGEGGGMAARHCGAAALLALGLAKDAATRLESIAQDYMGTPQQRTRLLSDAAKAWLSADETERAEGVLDAALALDDQNPDLRTDRAVVRAVRGNLAGAEADLDGALAINPFDVEAWTLRANARRRLGNTDGALKDAERALALDPGSPEALLERGLLRAGARNTAGARQDWLALLRKAPDSGAADAAREHLERLDVRTP